MKNSTEIIQPNDQIENVSNKALSEISELLPNSKLELVGAMAVPMQGRSEIDVMVISTAIENDSSVLETAGYKRGPVVKNISYLKKMEGGIEIGIQIMSADNKMVRIHRGIIEKLREDEDLRKSYEAFKTTLSGLSPQEYKEQKSAWLKQNILPLI